ncbi:hypothetical protein J8M20_02900 [Pseudoalteromonas luteoviolacea]|uniref:hypothetical protein n=1 Tax=Pseudoalteromonas luteoviolacea TaxID=43657 RepID=UPI001B37F273|nr:hypothetical protein [Pseudoalteromonas luteoviolacea]MBQ4810263.1 hypothetical protein [Pseudoalteromonas luteoviolacea]
MFRLITISIFLMSFPASAYTWLQYGEELECPDALEFNGDNYIIYNDCYGFDPREPIIESGHIETDNDYVYFLNRKVKQQSFLQGHTKSQKLKILLRNEHELNLQRGSRIFMFKRIKWTNSTTHKLLKRTQNAWLALLRCYV